MNALHDAIARMLADEGFLPDIDAPDEVVFYSEGTRFAFQIFSDDDTYTRLLSGYALGKGKSRRRALTCANDRNTAQKAVKTSVHAKESLVFFSVEQFFDEPVHLRAHLHRSISAIGVAAERFFADLNAPSSAQSRTRTHRE
jgi:hypothetical protein